MTKPTEGMTLYSKLEKEMRMEKILSDGTVLEKARFWRTTCKACRKELPKSIIMNEGKFCNKLCRRNWTDKKHKPKSRYVDMPNTMPGYLGGVDEGDCVECGEF